MQKFLRRLSFSEARCEGAGLRERVLSVQLKVMLPHEGYFHDTLYNIRVTDANTITCTTGDMQLTAPRNGKPWGVPKAGSPVFTTMRVLRDKVEMDLHGVEKWAWLTTGSSSYGGTEHQSL